MVRAERLQKSNLFWRIIISTIGIILILMAISNVMLFFFGDTSQATVETRRYGGARQGAVNDKRYTWYVDYTFRADNGEIYEGHLTKLGSDTSVSVSRTIYYFTFAPFLNTPEDTAKPNLGQLVMIVVGAFCCVVMNKKPKKNTRRPLRQNITDYDDSIENNYMEENYVEDSYMEEVRNKFCTNCGVTLSTEAHFCSACGSAQLPTTISVQATMPVSASTYPTSDFNQVNQQQYIGWTSHHLDSNVIQRAKKNKKNAWAFTIFLTVAFPFGFALAGLLMDDMPMDEAVIIGIGLGLLMLFIGIIQTSRMKAGIWEGTVTDKKKKQKMDHSQNDDMVRYKTVYTIFVTEDGGKQHKLRYTNNTAMYNYFNMGDRIRCHLSFGTYEKFDKSRDSQIYCNICGAVNDLSKDHCKYCRLPLFK